MTLRAGPLEHDATLPDGRVVRVRIGLPEDGYIRARELRTVTVELYGNGARGSGGTLQSSGVTVGQTATAGGVTAGSPTTVGGEGGNSANDSLGTVQIGGGAQASAGQGPPAESLSSGTPVALPARSGSPATPRSAGAKPSTAAHRSASPTPSHQTLGVQHASRSGTLPFTGVDLLYAALAGITLAALGLGLRRRSASA